ncbi:MAG: bifunctional riboflavin kinase/FAD synthetase [Isosphaeraceae bacterium]
MITLDESTEVPAWARGAFLAVGNFDGVHRGHSHLIGRLRANADRRRAPAVALTFDPHPIALLRPGTAPSPLVWTERKGTLLKDAGATEVGVFQTGPWLLGLTAREFFDRVVLEKFEAKGMVEGPNFAFGRDRGGDARLLGDWCDRAGIDFEIIEPSLVEGSLVSSSRLRRALSEGETEEARKLLGRPHRLRGLIVRGAARGAELGFPTANLDRIDTLIPADGVYAALAYREGQATPHATATHIGPNATFGEHVRGVESHILDFAGDLYGQTLELDLLDRLRPTRKFSGLDDLLPQIRADVQRAREVCQREQTRG